MTGGVRGARLRLQALDHVPWGFTFAGTTGTECLWSDPYFDGWLVNQYGTRPTGYGAQLSTYAGM